MQQLEYARDAKKVRRRRMFVLIGVVILLCSAMPFATRLGTIGLERMRVNRAYRACAAIAPPADRPVWEEDPAKRDALKGIADYGIVDSRNGQVAYWVPQQWQQFNASRGANLLSSGTLFLRELHKPNGDRRLVGVDIAGWSRGGPIVLFTRTRAYSPSDPINLPELKRAADPSVRLSDSEGVLRIFPGQPDPSNPSHFTIKYSVNDRAGMLDGWLKDDESILLEPRELTPATTAPTTASPRR